MKGISSFPEDRSGRTHSLIFSFGKRIKQFIPPDQSFRKRQSSNTMKSKKPPVNKQCCSDDPSKTFYESNSDKLGGKPEFILGGKTRKDHIPK